MKILIVCGLLAICSSALAADKKRQGCHLEVENHCTANNAEALTAAGGSCSSTLENKVLDPFKYDFTDYVRDHLSYSFQYLLMSTYFGEHVTNRAGFSKLYRKLSDETWEDAINVIKYMAQRGYRIDFNATVVRDSLAPVVDNPEMPEWESLSKALDIQKYIAKKGHNIHKAVHHDADAINYIEEKFAEKHTKTIRELSGHIQDLHKLSSNNPSLSLFLFDEHLKSLY